MKLSFLNVIVFAAVLSVGLFSCKSSKKAADAAQNDPPVVEVVEDEPEVVVVEVKEPKMSEKEMLSQKLSKYFNGIATANNDISAKNNIMEAKNLFASADVPVLIIINETADGVKDYDQPTTIKNYLNYLKDQDKNLNNIYGFKTNAQGKITELELIRK